MAPPDLHRPSVLYGLIKISWFPLGSALPSFCSKSRPTTSLSLSFTHTHTHTHHSPSPVIQGAQDHLRFIPFDKVQEASPGPWRGPALSSVGVTQGLVGPHSSANPSPNCPICSWNSPYNIPFCSQIKGGGLAIVTLGSAPGFLQDPPLLSLKDDYCKIEACRQTHPQTVGFLPTQWVLFSCLF